MSDRNGLHSDVPSDPTLSPPHSLHELAAATAEIINEVRSNREVLSEELDTQRRAAEADRELSAKRHSLVLGQLRGLTEGQEEDRRTIEAMARHMGVIGGRASLTEDKVETALAVAVEAKDRVAAFAWLRSLPKHPAVGIGIAVAALVAALLPHLLKGH